MKFSQKYLNSVFIILLSFGFSNCTAWPAISALLMQSKSGGGGMLLVPPGGSDAATTESTPTVLSSDIIVSTPTVSGYYSATTVIDINVKFTESVDVTGTPRLRLNNLVYVNYLSGTGTDTLLFRYTVQAGNSEDVVGLDTASQTALELNGGTIKSTATNKNKTLTLPVAGATNSMGNGKVIVIDTTAPTVTNITSSTTNGVYGEDGIISIQITFSETVDVLAANPQLTLETGTPDRDADCSPGTTTTTITCTYTVIAGDASLDLDYLSTNALTLNGSTIRDAAGNDANLTLAAPGATNSLGANKAIVIDTTIPGISFALASSNGAESSTSPTLTVNISSAPLTAAASVPYSVTSGTASGSGTDYTLASGTLTWAIGDSAAKTITLSIIDDTLDENNETIIVTLGTPTAASLGANTVHTYTINDNDAPPTVAFDATTSSGSEATTTLNIPVSLSTASGLSVTVDYSVTGGTATGSGTDFTLAAGTLTFAAGVTSQNISVTINNDVLDEVDETIIIDISNPGNSSLGTNTSHTHTINDNDSPPTVAFSATTSSGTEATTAVTIPVTLSAISGKTVTVNYAVSGGTATSGGTDFTLAAGTLTFTPGVTSQNISITINDDSINELSETIIVDVSTPSNATLGTNTSHTYTITDNDAAPTVAFTATTSNGSETTTSVNIPVSLSGNATSQTVTVGYSVTGGTATGSGTDYTLASGTLTFVAGDTSENISVTINNDSLDEANETIIVTLASPTVATLGTNTAHTYTINDDDPAPTVEFSTTASNGGEATTSVTIPVTLSTVSGQTVTVGYSVTGGTATGSGTDYTLAAGTLTFVAGDTSENISITVVNDGTTELDETIQVTLASPTNASLGTNTVHTYTINDNDPPTVAFSATTSTGSEATTAVTIPVTLSAAYSQTVTVGYSVTGGTATGSGTDYTLASGTLTFVAGDTSEDISITINNDTASESSETIIITLASPTVATLGTNTAHTYTITDNDTPDVGFSSTTSNGSESTTSVNIPVTLSFSSANTVTVGYSVTGGTATGSGTDYTLASGTLTFVAGDTSENIPITINNDSLNELNETIIVTISSPTNSVLGANTTHTYTINDDDTAPTVAFNATTSNASEATTSVTIPVSLSGNTTSQTVTVGYSVTGGTATGSGTDYTLASGTLTFVAGDTSENISITVVNDGTTELDETIVVTLASPTVATLGTNTVHTYTINDNDPPTVAFSSTTSNGSEATTAVTIPVTLSAAYSQTVTVGYSVTGGTATGSGTDYTLASGTLTFVAGDTSEDISVTINNDSMDEVNETIIITLASPTVATLGTNTAHTYTINDDDAAPTVAFSATTSNGSEATTAVTIPVTLSAVSGQTVTVGYSVTSGTATGSGTDFTLASGTLTFVAGDTSEDINFTVVNDGTTELDETIVVTLASPTNATLGTNTAHTYTINDNDPPTVAFSATTSNASEATTAVTIPVTLSAAYSQTVTVGYSVTGGTATGSGTDYTLASGTLTFVAGDTSENISITVVNDGTTEVDETIQVTLASPTIATLGTNTVHTYTINDNDPPTVAFSATTSNASEATTAVTIPVTLSAAYSQTVTVGYSVTGGTATGSGTDYTLASGTLTFVAGDTSEDISVTINNDSLDEANETIIVTLASPTVATLGTNTAHTYTINDDDPAPTVAFSATTSNASEATTAVTIPVTLSAASGQTVTVGYSVTGGTATGSGTDFTLASGTLTFVAGDISENISVTVINDVLNEANETIEITLASPTNSTLGTNTVHTYTINDNDAAPTVAFSATTSNGSEATTAVTIPVTLSAASGQTITVGYSVTGGTATGSGTDYTLASGTLTFVAGDTSEDISVTINNDSMDEANETIIVTLASPTVAALGTNTAHTYTINDDDAAPTVAFSATTSNGSEATTAVTIPVTLSAASGQTVTVGYSVTGGTATGTGTDYTLASGTLTFVAGDTSEDINITIVNDGTTELDETIVVTLASPTNATLGTNTAHTYTINDNDAPTVAFSATTSNGGEATTSVTIPVTLSAAYSQTVTVGYSVTGGTATGSGTDYTLAAGTLTFVAGDTSENISITVVNDGTTEVDETIQITLASPTIATLGTNTVHTYTINDNDPPTVAFSATTSNASETTTAVTIPVILSGAYSQTVTVGYSVTGGTATGSGTDYTLASGTLTFVAGDTSEDISITVVNDALNEANETIVVTLASPTVATLGTNTVHTYTIDNDDAAPTVAFSASTSSSGNESSTTRTIAVNLSAVSGQTVTVTVTDSGGTATSGTDYTAIGSPLTVTFTAGVTSQNVSIPVLQDLDFEGDETVQLTLSAPSNATLGGTTGHTFTITEDDVGILSAETMDGDNDGKIDHYKLTFSEALNDSSFPGYVLNSAGSAQTDWLVAGYTGVVLAHGSAAPEADTANDSVIYLKFTEGASSDTDAKPNLTTTATPTLVAASAKTIGRVYTATVVEADRAKPVIVSATATIATTLITITFSEPVWTASGMPACGGGGDLVAADFTYNNVSGNNASSIASMGADACGTDLVVNVNANTALMPADNTDTLVATTGIFDAANNNGNPTAKTIVATGGPTVTNIQLFDTDKNGNIDQAKVTFSITMQDSSTGDASASQFTIGGTAATKVDSVAGGTGTIASPNTDTGTSNDAIITLFTNNSTVTGTDLKTVAFTMAASKWLGNSVELQTIANLSSVTEDKAPPVILTAVAADNTTQAAGVDSDDTLVITFSEATNKPTINTANIASIFSLSSSHAWGTITSATWNGAGDILTLTFSGAGSPTVAVGDYITILGTIADTATSPNTSVNIASVAPITGNFYIDNIPPTLTNNFSVTPTKIRIVYSEAVNVSEATTVGNYKVVNTVSLAGTCAAGTNFSSSSQTGDFGLTSVTQINSTTFELTVNAAQVLGKQYTLIVNKTAVHDLATTPNAMGCPNYGSFIGQEVLKFASAACVNRYSLILGFSKPYKTGVNTTGSAECNSTAECNARYKFTGVSNLGNISSAVALDGSVCGGAAADTTKICITHSSDPTNLQKGGVYTIIGANATSGDSFDNTIAIRDSADVENLQSSPKDRVSFTGCYATPDYFTDGAIINDPFGDGSTFGYLVDFNSKIYIGPNQNGNAAARFGYAGSNPESIGFNFSIDTTGTTKSNTNAGPFYSIGHSGCTTNINTIGTACGPDNEDGRGVFAVGTISSTQYLFLAGARTTPSGSDYNFDYIYYTSDTSTDLNLKYIDLGTITGTVTAGTSAIATFTDRLYAGFGKVNDSGSNAPDFGRINFQATTGDTAPCTAGNSCDATNGTGGIRFFINYMEHFGGNGATTGTRNYARIAGVDSLFVFNDRIYAANGGHPTLDHNGSIIRSASTIPAGCNTGTQTCSTADWVEIGPRTNTKWHNSTTNNWYSLELSKFYDFIPADKAFPQFAEFNGNLYAVRNICIVANQGATTWAGSVSTTAGCLDGTTTNRRAQLWKCDPTASGVTTTCEAADWSLVGENGSTGFTDMGESTNTIITMVVKNGDYLYIGYDNTTGVRIYRTKVGVTNPTVASDFEQAGTAGLDGDTTNIQQIFSAISVLSGTDNYLYISAGKNSTPVKAYRHKN